MTQLRQVKYKYQSNVEELTSETDIVIVLPCDCRTNSTIAEYEAMKVDNDVTAATRFGQAERCTTSK